MLHPPTGRRLKYGALAADAAKLPVPKDVTLKQPKDFKLIGTPAKRLDTPAKVNGTAVFGIDVRPPGVKIATLAQSPVFGGRAEERRRQPRPRRSRACARSCGSTMPSPSSPTTWAPRRRAWRRSRSNGTTARTPSSPPPTSSPSSSRRRSSRARWRRTSATSRRRMAGAATKVEAIYQVPFLAHATMEPMNCTVHVRKDGCEVWVGTQVARARPGGGGQDGRPAAGQGRGPQPSAGRRLRPPAGGRRRHARRRDRQAGRRPGEGRVDARGGHPARHVPARTGSTGSRPGSTTRASRSPGTIASPAPRSSRAGRRRASTTASIPDTTDGAIDLVYGLPNMHVEYVRVEPPGIPTAFWRSVGPSHNVFVIESFIDELAAAAKQDPVAYRRRCSTIAARQGGAGARRGEGRLGPEAARGRGRGVSLQNVFGSYMAQVAEVEVAKDGAVRVRRVVCAVDCGTVVNPDTVRAQIQSAIIFGITAALYGEITLKDGRVEQTQLRQLPGAAHRRGAGDRGPYRAEHRAAGRHGRARHLGGRARRRQCDLRRDGQAPAQDADRSPRR